MNVACEVCGTLVLFEKYIEHVNSHEPVQRRNSLRHVEGAELPKNSEELPRASYRGKGLEKACQICLVDFENGEQLIYLPCVHRFHEGCILDWLKKQPVCPVCQKGVFVTAEVAAMAKEAKT